MNRIDIDRLSGWKKAGFYAVVFYGRIAKFLFRFFLKVTLCWYKLLWRAFTFGGIGAVIESFVVPCFHIFWAIFRALGNKIIPRHWVISDCPEMNDFKIGVAALGFSLTGTISNLFP